MSDQTSAPQKKPMNRVLRTVLLAAIGVVLVAFVGIQFIPVDRSAPETTTPIQWDSPQTESLARRACMDCHSNETVWPWYSYIAPSSWLVYYDVMRGRSQWNLSTMGAPRQFGGPQNDLAYQLGAWLAGEGGRRPGGRRGDFEGGRPEGFPPPDGQRPEGGFEGGRPGGGEGGGEFVERINNGSMPPANYTLLHPTAILTDAEKQQLIAGLQATFFSK